MATIAKYPIKTLIYISQEQKKRLMILAQSFHVSLAELIRNAIDDYVSKKKPKLTFKDVLNMTAGAWKDRTDIPDGVTYENNIRRGWSRRFKRETGGG